MCHSMFLVSLLKRFLNLLKSAFRRVTMVGIGLLAQGVFFAMAIWHFKDQSSWFFLAAILLSALVTLAIIYKNTNPAYKLAWVIPILLFPVFGGIFYLLMGGNRVSKRQRERMNSIDERMRRHLPQNPDTTGELQEYSPDVALESQYLQNVAGCPMYRNTHTTYYPLGDEAFPAMLEALRSAEKYIFLEYFIISPGYMWDSILTILKEKAAAGLDVRVMYDDFGSITQLPVGYRKELESFGIQCRVFMPFIPIMSPRLNNRDHRKMMIIDGRIAFTGGINLADEYINRKMRFGHWKDNGLELRGEAVWSMTVMFLSLWDYISNTRDTISDFLPPPPEVDGGGFIQPYLDTPLDDEAVGETVYLNLIARAHRSVWIMTPYLIPDHFMVESLCNAAKSGLDVRIIVPHIPDKKLVHAVAKSHYEVLISAGVKVYEYTPGFIHAKVFCVDGRLATVGTINLDYRSLYLHFENGVFMYMPNCIDSIIRDFENTFRVSQAITLADCKVSVGRKLLRAMLRLIAPLM